MRNNIVEHNRVTLNQLMNVNRELLAEVNSPENSEQVKIAMMREILRNTETIMSNKQHFVIQVTDDKVQEFQAFIDSARDWLNKH